MRDKPASVNLILRNTYQIMGGGESRLITCAASEFRGYLGLEKNDYLGGV